MYEKIVKTKTGDKNKRDDVENVLDKLAPIIEKVIMDAPEWGTISLNIFLNAKTIKRIEIATKNSIQF